MTFRLPRVRYRSRTPRQPARSFEVVTVEIAILRQVAVFAVPMAFQARACGRTLLGKCERAALAATRHSTAVWKWLAREAAIQRT